MTKSNEQGTCACCGELAQQKLILLRSMVWSEQGIGMHYRYLQIVTIAITVKARQCKLTIAKSQPLVQTRVVIVDKKCNCSATNSPNTTSTPGALMRRKIKNCSENK